MPETNKNLKRIQKHYLHLQQKFIDWANTEVDIRTCIVVGSLARTDHKPDEWSDLDIMIYTLNPDQYLRDTRWISEIGEVWIALPSRTAGNEPEILVTFAGGFNVDFVFNPITQLVGMVRDNVIPAGHWRGARIILDKDGYAGSTIPKKFKPPVSPLPEPGQFDWTVNAFWYTAYYLARQLQRGELVMYQNRDEDIKRCVIQMMEWHARSRQPETDTWHMGRFIQEWADPRAWKAFQATYAPLEPEACWQALNASIDLFHWMSKETANALRLPYTGEVDQHFISLVNDLQKGAFLTPPEA